jgi:hypothetical protein
MIVNAEQTSRPKEDGIMGLMKLDGFTIDISH